MDAQIAKILRKEFACYPAGVERFETLDSIDTPDGQTLTLHQRGGDYFIYLDGDELMSTRAPGSERGLASLGCQHLRAHHRARVLIGGLGLGFTLETALAELSARSEVVVAEAFPQVVTWNRGHLAGVNGEALKDPRVKVLEVDVWDALEPQAAYDAILLDVDNGPAAWCLASNARLYEPRGLSRVREALSADGVLSIWSAHPDPAFEKRLRKSGWKVRCERLRAHGQKGARHVVFLCQLV